MSWIPDRRVGYLDAAWDFRSRKVTTMDVILDSNIFLQDAKMGGTQFQELFAHLRRTGSRLVIPIMVFHEVAERYRNRLQEKVTAVSKAWYEMRKVAMSDQGSFHSPHVNSEVHDLRTKLKQPVPGVEVLLYSDLSGVDVQEVIRRGIKRIRPSSEKGEELRDVILWMIVQQYARSKDAEVAFVSDDATFRDGDGKGLHSQLANDIAMSGAKVAFYRRIGDFVTAQAMETEEITGEWLFALVPKEKLEQEARRRLAKAAGVLEEIRRVEIETVSFVGGKKFKVEADEFYVECSFLGRAQMTALVKPLTTFNQNFIVAPPQLGMLGLPTFEEGVPLKVVSPLPTGKVFATFNQAYQAMKNAGPIEEKSVERKYGLAFGLEVSVRIANGKVLAWQIDKFWSTEEST